MTEALPVWQVPAERARWQARPDPQVPAVGVAMVVTPATSPLFRPDPADPEATAEQADIRPSVRPAEVATEAKVDLALRLNQVEQAATAALAGHH